MAETELGPGWRWEQLDDNPTLKVVVAAFSGRIGDRPGDLPTDDFFETMYRAFPDKSPGAHDVAKSNFKTETENTSHLKDFGILSIRMSIINVLGENAAFDVTSGLCALAGGDEERGDGNGDVAKEAERARDGIRRVDYPTAEALQRLSAMAVEQMAPIES